MITRKSTVSEICEILRNADLHQLPRLKIAVLRNITVEPLEPYLRFMAYHSGFHAEVRFGQFDNILQEAADSGNPLWRESPDILSVFSKLEVLSPPLAFRFPTLTPNQLEDEIQRVQTFIEATLTNLRKHTSAAVLWHGFESPPHPALGIHDMQIENGQLATVSRINLHLKRCLQEVGNAYLVDLNLCMARLGVNHYYDRRCWHFGRAPYSREALEIIASEDLKFIRSLKGKSKKCLVLDCDQTLWGGIIGEDGLGGIALSGDYPGSAYREFQEEILSLHNRGVILALCSKNNEDDVREVFQRHPDMVLKEKHIAAAQINWDDKALNLRRIADELNIGLDSMVFADDSEFEAGYVRETIPEIQVIHLPSNRPAEFRHILASCGYFDTLTVSGEDRLRGKMYRAEAERRKLMASVPDLQTYLSSLHMQITVEFLDELSLPRIAQLTQRTNQFNLTTKRYSESELYNLAASQDYDILFLRLEDRFGSYGIVGASILRYEGTVSEIDTFLLSCRVIGRGVEDAFLFACVETARRRPVAVLRGRYVRTAKNDLVSDFYLKHGFTTEYENSGEASYSLKLTHCGIRTPEHIQSLTIGRLEEIELEGKS